MEVPNGDNNMIMVVITELLGIMGYSLAVNLNDGTHVAPLMLFTMICVTQTISGGHLNPALTLAVYIERNKLISYALWALTIGVSQLIGAMGGIFMGYILRAELPANADATIFYFVPGQYPFIPKIIEETRGLPAYG